MATSIQATDSDTSDTSSPMKGLTQIALGAAAGAFVASRMSRGALMLTAGLAYALYKQTQAPKAAASVEPEAATAPPEETAMEAAPAAPAPVSHPVVSLSPDPAPPATVAPVANAWDDLRAALSPVLAGAVSKTEPLTPDITKEPEPPVMPQAPPMFEMSVCPPSSPLMVPDLDDGIDLPDEIEFPEPPESEEESPFGLMLSASEPSIQPVSLGLTETLIVPKPGAQPLNPGSAPPVNHSLEAPVVLPRDAQARKNFFDWLRS